MKKSEVGKWQSGLTTSEMVVYPMIAIVLIGVIYGFYHNSRIDNAVSAAVDLGLEQRVIIEEYFDVHGEMPQSVSDIDLSSYTPQGIFIGMDYRAGELGVPAADKLRTGTLKVLVDMKEFGARFKDIKSGFLLIARAEDNFIKWDCVADQVTVDALSKRYLPETCSRAKDEEDEEYGDGE